MKIERVYRPYLTATEARSQGPLCQHKTLQVTGAGIDHTPVTDGTGNCYLYQVTSGCQLDHRACAGIKVVSSQAEKKKRLY
jgi:hypothetical protein